MALALTSTLSDVLAEFVVMDADHTAETPIVTIYENAIKVLWADTSRVRLDVSLLSLTPEGLAMKVNPPVELPGGGNPNNPPAAGQ